MKKTKVSKEPPTGENLLRDAIKQILSQDSNICLFKMKYSGEEIISYAMMNETSIYFINPVRLHHIINPEDGTATLMMIEWISSRITNDMGFLINFSDVLCNSTVNEEITTSYKNYCTSIGLYDKRPPAKKESKIIGISDEEVRKRMSNNNFIISSSRLN